MSRLSNENIGTTKDTINNILRNAVASKCKSTRRIPNEFGKFTISKTNTFKIKLSKEVQEYLQYPPKVKVSFNDDSIFIAKELPDNKSNFNVSNNGVICSVPLGNEIEATFDLDFSDRTYLTFNEVDYALNDDYPVVIFKVR